MNEYAPIGGIVVIFSSKSPLSFSPFLLSLDVLGFLSLMMASTSMFLLFSYVSSS